MPLVFLAVAFQLQSSKWRYLFLVFALISFILNIFYQEWLEDYYAFTGIALLFMLNPYFSIWWKNRNNRQMPVSFLHFCKEIYWVAKQNKLVVLGWIVFLAVTVFLVFAYTSYTGYVLLGSILFIFAVLFALKHVVNALLPPEWFLHDSSTRYVFLAVFIVIITSHFIRIRLGGDFIIPMGLAVIFSLIGFYWIKDSSRFFMPGCALILADLAWQIIRFMHETNLTPVHVLLTQLILIIAMIVGIIWLVKKPGIFPILYLVLFQLFRISGFIIQALDRFVSDNLSSTDVTYYVLYLVCWMYIVPFLFWLTAFLNQTPESPHKPRMRSNLNKLLNNKQS